jgi:hypothetical protein
MFTRYANHTTKQLQEVEANIMDAARLNWAARQDCWEKGDRQGFAYVTQTIEYLAELWNELQGEREYRAFWAARAESKLHQALIAA